jgi:hypothetical protein
MFEIQFAETHCMVKLNDLNVPACRGHNCFFPSQGPVPKFLNLIIHDYHFRWIFGAYVQCTLSILPMCCNNGMVPAHGTDQTQ